MIAATHLAAHLIIFVGYIAAVARVPGSFRALIELRARTITAAGGFFLFCGLTHLSLATHTQNAAWVTATDHLQAASIITFLIFLTTDLQQALARLENAFRELRHDLGDDTADRVAARIAAALRGH
jgi:hypothetical protein